jgi:hypothetical protein
VREHTNSTWYPTANIPKESKDFSQFGLKEGKDLTIENQKSFLDRCKFNMSFIKICKFVFKKKDMQWKSLTDLLKEYNENLRSYGPKFDLEKMIKGEFEILRKLQKDQLRRRAEASAYEAQISPAGSDKKKTYQNIALAASFSTVVKYERANAVYKFNMSEFRLDPSYMLSSSPQLTMALLFDYPVRKENRVVLIEWIGLSNRDSERDNTTKALMLAAPKPGQLLLPACYGMVEDPRGERLGLVLVPPAHIRSNLPQILTSGAISQKRMPISLQELMEKKHAYCVGTLELGMRFRLAKKLIDAVHTMHCVGWVHK